MAKLVTLLWIVALVGCNNDDGWTPQKRAEYERQKAAAEERLEHEHSEREAAALEAQQREKARIDAMTASQLLADMQTRGKDCATSACYLSAAEDVAYLMPVLRKKGATERQMKKATDYYHRIRAAGENMQATADSIEDYKARVKQCCDAPKFMHPLREKKQCIAWGLKKCVADSDEEVEHILRTFD